MIFRKLTFWLAVAGITGAVLFFGALLGLSALVWLAVEMPARRGILSLAKPR